MEKTSEINIRTGNITLNFSRKIVEHGRQMTEKPQM